LPLKVARSGDILISVPEDSMISLHNSPYYSHNHGSAIDLYPSNPKFGSPAPSPIDGTVRYIRRFKSPESRWFEAPPFEPLLLVESDENPELLLKILHLDPSVKENDHVYVGDHIGTYLRSGYFHPWTDPHLHIEVRRRPDLIRARGGLPIDLLNNLESSPFTPSQISCISGQFSLITDEYVLVETRSPLPRLGYYSGLTASIGGVNGILDCGIPHYRFGGLYTPSTLGVRSLSILEINGRAVGRVCKSLNSTILFETLSARIEVNGIPILGLSLRLHLGDSRTVKIIPTDPSSFPFTEGDSAEISIQGAAPEN